MRRWQQILASLICLDRSVLDKTLLRLCHRKVSGISEEAPVNFLMDVLPEDVALESPKCSLTNTRRAKLIFGDGVQSVQRVSQRLLGISGDRDF